MKKLFNIAVTIVIALFFACDKDKPQQEPFLITKPEALNFPPELSSQKMNVETNQTWSFSISNDAKQWISVEQIKNELLVKVTSNSETSSRKGGILIKAGILNKNIPVEQLGTGANIIANPDIFTIRKDGEDIMINVMSSTDYEIIIPENVNWITKKSETIKQDKSKDIIFTIARNITNQERTAQIVFKGGLIEKKVIISQKKEVGYDGTSSGDIKDDIKVPVAGGTDTSHEGTDDISKSFDGDFTTIYHSKWDNRNSNYFPITLEYFFDNQPQIDYLIYHPRQQGYNGFFKEIEIWYKTKENPTYIKEGDFDFKGASTASRVVFKNPIINPTGVKIVVKSGYGDGKGFASCAEMEFFQKNLDNYDPSAIFTDITCSQLKTGITEEQINQIPNVLYKSIAYYLFKNQYPKEFRIAEFKAYPHPDDFAKINKISTYSLVDNPTGISVSEGEEFIVFVGETNQTLGLKIQNLDKPGGDGYGEASYYTLTKGVNKIKARNKGLAYVLYHTNNYLSAPKVKIHFATGKVNGYFDSQKHDASEWTTRLNAAVDKYFDVVGTKAHLTFETENFKTHTRNNGKELIDLYDDLVKKEQEFMGFMKYNRITTNRAYFHVVYHSHMYSTNNRTAYNVTTVSEILNPERLKKSPWGPAHELGHTHQTRPTMKWHGTTEVTTNIHSLWIQTQWGNKSRLETENRYAPAFNFYIVNQNAFLGLDQNAEDTYDNAFGRLVPFWQLQLYMANVKGHPDFYADLYEKVRTTDDKKTPGEQQLDFVRKVCEVAQLDLTDFFEKMGFLRPINRQITDYSKAQVTITQGQIDALKNEIKTRGYSTPAESVEYITDSSWQVYKNQQTIISGGKATISGTTITIPTNWQNAVAFEVYENDKLIFVSDKHTLQLNKNVDSSTMKIYAIAYNGTKVQVQL